jgi:hypothetical protein
MIEIAPALMEEKAGIRGMKIEKVKEKRARERARGTMIGGKWRCR